MVKTEHDENGWTTLYDSDGNYAGSYKRHENGDHMIHYCPYIPQNFVDNDKFLKYSEYIIKKQKD